MERNYKIGQYHYGRKHTAWGVWVVDRIEEDGTVWSKSAGVTFWSRNEAREYVYKMNGWGIPKNRVEEF